MQVEEKYQTEGFKEIALIYGTAEESFRKTSALINRIRHQEEGGTPFRTVRETVEDEGSLLQEYFEQKASSIFQAHGFTPAGCPQSVITESLTPNALTLSEEALEEIRVDYNILKDYKAEILKKSCSLRRYEAVSEYFDR